MNYPRTKKELIAAILAAISIFSAAIIYPLPALVQLLGEAALPLTICLCIIGFTFVGYVALEEAHRFKKLQPQPLLRSALKKKREILVESEHEPSQAELINETQGPLTLARQKELLSENPPGATTKPVIRNTKKIKFRDEQGKSLTETFEFDEERPTKEIIKPEFNQNSLVSRISKDGFKKFISTLSGLIGLISNYFMCGGKEQAEVLAPRKPKGTTFNQNYLVSLTSKDDLEKFINTLSDLISNYSMHLTSEPDLSSLADKVNVFYLYTITLASSESSNTCGNIDDDKSDNAPRERSRRLQEMPHPAMWKALRDCAQSWVEFYHYKFESDRKKLLAETQNNSNTDALAQETLQKLIEKDKELSQPNESCEYNPNYKAAEYLKDINDIVQALDDSPSIMSDLIKNKKNELYAKIIFHTLERIPVCPNAKVLRRKLQDHWIQGVFALIVDTTLLTDSYNHPKNAGDENFQRLLRDFASSSIRSPCVSIGVLLPFLYVLHDAYTGRYNKSYYTIYKCPPSTEGELSIEQQQAIHAQLHQSLDLEKLLSLIDQLDESISCLEGSNDVLAYERQKVLDLISKMRKEAKPLSTEDQVTQQAQISTQIDCPDAMSLQSSNDRGL